MLETGLAANCHPRRRRFGKVRSSVVAVKCGKFLIGHTRPLGTELSEPRKPTLAILTVKARRLPNEKEAMTGKQGANSPNELPLLTEGG